MIIYSIQDRTKKGYDLYRQRIEKAISVKVYNSPFSKLFDGMGEILPTRMYIACQGDKIAIGSSASEAIENMFLSLQKYEKETLTCQGS